MNPDVKAQWIAALRSGDYKQGQGALRRRENTFCCLGVLMDLAVKANVVPEGKLWGNLYFYDSGSDREDVEVGNSGALLTDPVSIWADVSPAGALPTVVGWTEEDYVRKATSLMALNDDAGYTFKQIADVIEMQL